MPYTPVDPKPDFPKLEEQLLKFWEEQKIFQKSLDQTKDNEPFTFYDGPPFATGLPHYGHILASTVKDLFPRYQTMRGRFVRRRWGWDCHGLPIEELVERKLGISGKKQIEEIGIEKFNATCRSMVLEFADEWRKMVRQIARWIDFDRSYKTMDRDYMESVWWAFKQTYDKGLVYEGRRVLLYCPRCETPVSNFEVAMDNSYKDVTEEAVTVKFKVLDPDHKNTFFLAWTTTPWTLPGNLALAVGADIEYVKVKSGDEYFILAQDRVGPVLHDRAKPGERFKGSELVGIKYEPLFDLPDVANDKSYQVYAADFVNTQEGTGIVHTAVVYGEDDYNLGMKNGLPVVPLLDEKGKFNTKAPKFLIGLYFKDSEKLIKEDLDKRNLLLDRHMHAHSYPHCWRCGTTLFYNAIPAWFINIQKIKDKLLKSNQKEINWYPDHLKHGRYHKSVEAAPDWNISRNRFWGNPIPVWKCEQGHHTVVGSIAELSLKRNSFFFTRHAQGRQNVLGINSSWPEKETYDLTQEGVARAHDLGKQLQKSGGLDLIFTSDLLRTKRTAEIIAEITKAQVTTDERLREFDLGEYNGKTYEEFNREFPNHTRWTKGPPGGENWQDIEKRMISFLEEINAKYQGKRILIVSHGDPLWVVQQHYGSQQPYPVFATAFEIDISIPDLHRPYIDQVILKCKQCGKEARRISEIFDSWVEAGSMPFAEYHYPFDQKQVFESRYPGQFVAEYIAQTRAWFYVMHVMGYNLFGKAPFENVVTTGNVLNEKGEKLSKSKLNYVDPWITLGKYGVDALRFHLMNSAVMQSDDLYYDEKDTAIVYRKNVLILWNIYNYFVTYANEAGFDPKTPWVDKQLTSALDQWAVAITKELVNDVTKHLDNYDTVRATRAIEGYINNLSTWYLRRSRGRKDQDFFLVLRHCLINSAMVMAPITPYISEEVFRNLDFVGSADSVHLQSWPKTSKLTKQEQELLFAMDAVREAATVGLAARKQLKIPLRQPLSRLAMELKNDKIKLTPQLWEVLLSELNVKSFDEKLVSESSGNNKIYGFEGSTAVKYFYLDTVISQELKLEGLARALERTVQEMRKNIGLRVGEYASLSYDTTDAELGQAMKLFDAKKTYLSKIIAETLPDAEQTEISGKFVKLKLG